MYRSIYFYLHFVPIQHGLVFSDPKLEVDVEKENKEFMERSEVRGLLVIFSWNTFAVHVDSLLFQELYEAMEASRWNAVDSLLSDVVPKIATS